MSDDSTAITRGYAATPDELRRIQQGGIKVTTNEKKRTSIGPQSRVVHLWLKSQDDKKPVTSSYKSREKRKSLKGKEEETPISPGTKLSSKQILIGKRMPFKLGPRGGRTKITSIYFRKLVWTKENAINWLKKHNYNNATYKKETRNNHVFKINKNSKDSRITYRKKFLDKNKTISATIMIFVPGSDLEEKLRNLLQKRNSSNKRKVSKRKSRKIKSSKPSSSKRKSSNKKRKSVKKRISSKRRSRKGVSKKRKSKRISSKKRK